MTDNIIPFKKTTSFNELSDILELTLNELQEDIELAIDKISMHMDEQSSKDLIIGYLSDLVMAYDLDKQNT